MLDLSLCYKMRTGRGGGRGWIYIRAHPHYIRASRDAVPIIECVLYLPFVSPRFEVRKYLSCSITLKLNTTTQCTHGRGSGRKTKKIYLPFVLVQFELSMYFLSSFYVQTNKNKLNLHTVSRSEKIFYSFISLILRHIATFSELFYEN